MEEPAPARRQTRAAIRTALDDAGPALVWIDSREAIIARLRAGKVEVERLPSDVPARHRSTGHVRHDPRVRHGGGGAAPNAAEQRRLEHLARFLDAVERRLPPAADLLLTGPGTVHERLARDVGRHDEHQGVTREIRCEVAPRQTARQLAARLRLAAGGEPRRRTVGAYRWTDASSAGERPDRAVAPRRVIAKPSRPARSRAPNGMD